MTLEYAKEELGAYVRKEHPLGHFLTACLAHDLFEAVNRADPTSMENLKSIVQYIYCQLPGTCHGSRERVMDWLDDETDTSNWKRGDS